MERLIPVVNQLQDVFTAVGSSPIALPQLVVVGSQSAGKSSVLENIVGRDFLPRGNNIVTRCPLVLQLLNNATLETSSPSSLMMDAKENEEDENSPRGAGVAAPWLKPSASSKNNEGASGLRPINANVQRGAGGAGAPPPAAAAAKGKRLEEYGEFLHLPGKRFYNFEEIRAEIEAETERITGNNKNVSNQPINLKIVSPHVLPLTLVDLPGMTKVPVGDQPPDIEQQIRRMIMSFISNDQSIIVAVSPANSDIANSDALKIAREVDPAGERTLGVVTKLDLMDDGTDAMDILCGRVVPLALGYVGIVNRSQAAINKKLPINEALAAEQRFFASHPRYRTVSDRMGTAYLARRLNQLLMRHIQASLPEMRALINTTVAETQRELDSYGVAMVPGSAGAGPMLLHLLAKFTKTFCDALDGKSDDLSITRLCGGARISFVFHDVFGSTIDSMDALDQLTDADIRTAIRNATGPRPSLFIPEVSFELLVKKQIVRLERPALQCVDLVLDELKRVASQCEAAVPELSRFPKLKDHLLGVVRKLLGGRLKPTKEMISALVNIELAYINTNHPDFVGGSKAVASLMSNKNGRNAANRSASNGAGAGGGGGGGGPNAGGKHSLASGATKKPSGNGGNGGGLLSMIFGGNSKKTGNKARARSQSHSAVMASPAASAAASSSITGNGSAASMGAGETPMERILASKRPTEREVIETQIICSLLRNYFGIVKKNIKDSVPKAVMHLLVNHCKRDLQSELVRALYQEALLSELMSESQDMAGKRKDCEELLGIMRKALDIVNQLRDFEV